MVLNKKFPACVYNEDGLEIYREEENGYWVKREYDEFGRQIYWENSAGEWVKHKFDDAGNEIHYENSDGFWYKAEFSESGFRTYYEDSNGKVFGSKCIDSLVNDAVERSAEIDKSENRAALEKEL